MIEKYMTNRMTIMATADTQKQVVQALINAGIVQINAEGYIDITADGYKLTGALAAFSKSVSALQEEIWDLKSAVKRLQAKIAEWE